MIFRNSPFIVLSLLLFSSFLTPPKRTNIIFKHGSRLVYTIENKNTTEEFVVTIRKLTPDLVFNYELSNSGKKGSVTIPAKDMDSARILNSAFPGGSVTLDNQVSLFLSHIIYAEVAMAGMNDYGTNFVANPGEAIDTFSRGEPIKKDIKVNGRLMPIDVEKFYDHVDPVSGNYHYTFTILKNENFPLILDMDLGWNLHLKQIEDVEITKTED
jgi:nitrogen fixation protein